METVYSLEFCYRFEIPIEVIRQPYLVNLEGLYYGIFVIKIFFISRK